MNIVVFHGQSHHGNTYHLTERLLHALQPAQVTAFTMADIPPCVGCAQCIMATEAACPHHSRICLLYTSTLSPAFKELPIQLFHVGYRDLQVSA